MKPAVWLQHLVQPCQSLSSWNWVVEHLLVGRGLLRRSNGLHHCLRDNTALESRSHGNLISWELLILWHQAAYCPDALPLSISCVVELKSTLQIHHFIHIYSEDFFCRWMHDLLRLSPITESSSTLSTFCNTSVNFIPYQLHSHEILTVQ